MIIPNQVKLEDLPQLEILQYLTGKLVKLGDTITNPVRIDTSPGCSILSNKGIIVLYDHSYKTSYNVVTITKKLTGYNYYTCLELLARKFILREDVFVPTVNIKYNDGRKKRIGSKTTIEYEKRRWNNKDADFWLLRGINSNMLKEDKVVPVKSYTIINDNYVEKFYPTDLSYGYIFEDRIKIYFPERKKGCKFISTLKKTDYHIWKGDDFTILAKAYKDGRILHNITGHTVISVQSECVPENIESIDCVIYDNDATGIAMANEVVSKYNCKTLIPPNHKDFDEWFVDNQEDCINYLKNNL